jgi:hypothetical protein
VSWNPFFFRTKIWNPTTTVFGKKGIGRKRRNIHLPTKKAFLNFFRWSHALGSDQSNLLILYDSFLGSVLPPYVTRGVCLSAPIKKNKKNL